MSKYEKIETIFKRDVDGSKKLLPWEWRNDTVESLKDIVWDWTEKIDGTNIRVFWDGHSVSFAGRKDKSIIPDSLLKKLNEMFCNAETEEIFEQLFADKVVTLFGEGYGNHIQSVGKQYISDDVSFILFDVKMFDSYYLERHEVNEIAKALGIDSVPVVGSGTLEDAISFVVENHTSAIGSCKMEGIVCRPHNELRDRFGNRIIVKIRYNDFKELQY